MSLLKQIALVTEMNLRSIPRRLGSSSVIVLGTASVVAVLVSVMAMATGMMSTMQNTGRADRAIVLRHGSASETGSNLSQNTAAIVQDAPGIRRDADGAPLTCPEVLAQINLRRNGDYADVNATMRGVGRKLLQVRPEIKIIQGREFAHGTSEAIVGKAATAQYNGMKIGDKFTTRGGTWTVVGVFSSAANSRESEVMVDVDTLMSLEQRFDFQSITVLLSSPDSFDQFSDSLVANPAVSVDVVREKEYFKRQSKTIASVLFLMVYIVGGVMSLGAVFGALNTMYSAVSGRIREIATLRAIGFGAIPVLMSVLIEALMLAAIGGAIGGGLAWIFFDGLTFSSSAGGAARGGHIVFELTVTLQVIAIGLACACTIGFVGGLFPALRAIRVPVAEALRAI
jgi:putative ABC transport system permease protein